MMTWARVSRLMATIGVMGCLPATTLAQRVVSSAMVQSGTLSFEGSGTLGDFVGTTDSVSGSMSGVQGLAAVRGWVEAPVRTLVTGNRRRDRDLNKSMETDRFPSIRFDLDSVEVLDEAGDLALVTLHGQLTVHGVTRAVDLPGTVQFSSDQELHLLSDFPLNLKDYDIGGLSKFFGLFKMYPDIMVHVDLVFGPRVMDAVPPEDVPDGRRPLPAAQSPAEA